VAASIIIGSCTSGRFRLRCCCREPSLTCTKIQHSPPRQGVVLHPRRKLFRKYGFATLIDDNFAGFVRVKEIVLIIHHTARHGDLGGNTRQFEKASHQINGLMLIVIVSMISAPRGVVFIRFGNNFGLIKIAELVQLRQYPFFCHGGRWRCLRAGSSRRRYHDLCWVQHFHVHQLFACIAVLISVLT